MKKIIVMGVGNYILSDEGVGIHVIRELEKMQWPENVEIYDCGTTGILSFHKFVEADILIAIDAIALKEEPGTVRVYNKDDIMLSKVPMKISPHQIGFQETLFQAELHSHAPEVVTLIGVVPESYAAGTELSECIAEKLPEIVEMTVKYINKYVEELKAKSAAELNEELVAAKKELFNLRFQNATNQLENTSRIKEVRKNIARIQTVIAEKTKLA